MCKSTQVLRASVYNYIRTRAQPYAGRKEVFPSLQNETDTSSGYFHSVIERFIGTVDNRVVKDVGKLNGLISRYSGEKYVKMNILCEAFELCWLHTRD